VEPGGRTGIFGGGPGLQFSRAAPAWSGGAKDEDGVTRRMPPPANNGLDSFARVAAAKKLGHAVSQPGDAWIDFPVSSPRTLSFSDVERGEFPAAAVRGKVVVIGATSPKLQDVSRTAVDDAMPGPELQAARIATALDGYPLRDAAGWIDVLLVVVLGAIGPLVALRLGGLVGLAAIAVGAALFVVGAQLAFNDGTVLTVVPPLTAAFVGLVVVSPFAVRDPHPLLDRLLDRISPALGNRRTRRLRLQTLGTMHEFLR